MRKIQCIFVFLRYQVEKLLNCSNFSLWICICPSEHSQDNWAGFCSLFHPYIIQCSTNHRNACAISFTGRDLNSHRLQIAEPAWKDVGVFYFYFFDLLKLLNSDTGSWFMSVHWEGMLGGQRPIEWREFGSWLGTEFCSQENRTFICVPSKTFSRCVSP